MDFINFTDDYNEFELNNFSEYLKNQNELNTLIFEQSPINYSTQKKPKPKPE